jgi:Uma2 family endonuclease
MAVNEEPEVVLPDVTLVESDGIPLETPWHNAQICLLIDVLTWLYRDRSDFYVGGNMFLYYRAEQARTRDYRGPDFFYVNGVNRLPPRPYWAVWQEGGRYPDLIMELLSPTTAVTDRTTKKTLYERTFRTPEYCCYDPDTQRLEGWRLGGRGRYRAIKPDKRGWLWLEVLELWLGLWEGTYLGLQGTWLRFFHRDGQLVPIGVESAEVRIEAERQKAEAARQKAKAERQRAETERQRAEAAEAELARLKARLAELEGQS